MRCWPLALLLAAFGLSACVQGQKATDTGDPGFPFGPSAIGFQPLAYVQDIKPILDRDCLSCHSRREARGNYSVATYADVLSDQTLGDARKLARGHWLSRRKHVPVLQRRRRHEVDDGVPLAGVLQRAANALGPA